MRLCYTIRMAEKIALVTGASSGFGLLTSIELAKAGFRVVATMRDLGRRDRLEQAIAAAGTGAMVDIRVLDVTKFDAIQGSVDAVVRDYGRLDVLVNNAGLQKDSPLEIMSLADWQLVINVNLTGQFLCSREAVKEFLRRGIVSERSCAAHHARTIRAPRTGETERK